ncbi:hypothetical protein NPIL_308401 [Nephila pilipes]|uniref:Uncharacterized protein n=1 Tax=Nephila pilipes TaxID=299642 RepID=A0A8X6NS83_NEPPI|nr:hypothetical protein NPIL_308401 [Nephila pilipes]
MTLPSVTSLEITQGETRYNAQLFLFTLIVELDCMLPELPHPRPTSPFFGLILLRCVKDPEDEGTWLVTKHLLTNKSTRSRECRLPGNMPELVS